MQITKQTWLGVSLLVGGVVMFLALAKQPSVMPAQGQQVENVEEIARPTPTPLTTDVDTERRILEQRQREREEQVRLVEEQSQALLKAQAQASEDATRKAQEEALVVQTRPESQVLADQEAKRREAQEAQAKAKTQTKPDTDTKTETKKPQERYTVQAGDTLTRLSREHGIPVAAIAAANNMKPTDALQRGKVIRLPSAQEIKALEAKAQAEQKQQAEAAAAAQKQQSINERLAQVRREAKRQGVNENYSVQVALASNQENADALVKKYKAAGYRVSAVQSGRGIRVVIGPERTREAALLLRDKIASDSSVGASGAWVLQLPNAQ